MNRNSQNPVPSKVIARRPAPRPSAPARRPSPVQASPAPEMVAPAAPAPVVHDLALRPRTGGTPANLLKSRGYRMDDLHAVAEIAHHYLFSGGTRLALTLFEGLQAVAPTEAYFALGLGLTHDHLGSPVEAERWYAKAAELDSGDPRADINRAELRIEARDYARARELLIRGANKARARADSALETKARALLKHLDRVVSRA